MSISNRSEAPIRVNDPQTPVIYCNGSNQILGSETVFEFFHVFCTTPFLFQTLFEFEDTEIEAPITAIYKNMRSNIRNTGTTDLEVVLMVNQVPSALKIIVPANTMTRTRISNTTDSVLVERGDLIEWRMGLVTTLQASGFSFMSVESHPLKIG